MDRGSMDPERVGVELPEVAHRVVDDEKEVVEVRPTARDRAVPEAVHGSVRYHETGVAEVGDLVNGADGVVEESRVRETRVGT